MSKKQPTIINRIHHLETIITKISNKKLKKIQIIKNYNNVLDRLNSIEKKIENFINLQDADMELINAFANGLMEVENRVCIIEKKLNIETTKKQDFNCGEGGD